jgi:hypothetical protein
MDFRLENCSLGKEEDQARAAFSCDGGGTLEAFFIVVKSLSQPGLKHKITAKNSRETWSLCVTDLEFGNTRADV